MCVCIVHRFIKPHVKFWQVCNFLKNTFGHGSICGGWHTAQRKSISTRSKNHLYRQSGYSTKTMDGVALRADITDISSYWLWILSTLPPTEWRGDIWTSYHRMWHFYPSPFHLFFCPGGIFFCNANCGSPESNLVTGCPSQLLGEVSTTFLSLGLLLSSQPWADSICCAENLADLHSF